MAIPLSYNVRNVLRRPVSTLTTAVGVGLTVMIFIGALALAEGFHTALVQTGSPRTRSCCGRAPTASCRAASAATR